MSNDYVTKSLWETKNEANDQMFAHFTSSLERVEGMTQDIHRIIAGNGEVGLCGKVEANTKEIEYAKGKIDKIIKGSDKVKDRVWQLIVKFAPYIGMAVLAYIAAKSNGTIK